jgi:hypothetical protein
MIQQLLESSNILVLGQQYFLYRWSKSIFDLFVPEGLGGVRSFRR